MSGLRALVFGGRRKMKMPTSVIVGPYDIKIGELDPSESEHHYGMFNSQKMEIRLCKEFSSPVRAADTLLHEVIHSIFHIANITTANPEDEERLVTSLSTQICAVVRQNPDLIKYLQESLKGLK